MDGTRKRHTWKVTLQRSDGEVVEREVKAFWDPEQEDCNEAVGRTAKAEAWVEGNKQFDFAPIAVARAK